MTTATHCPYCALQCAMTLTPVAASVPVEVSGRDFPTNRGGLCKKGWTSAELLASPDRLTTPLRRGDDGALHPIEWDAALDLLADRLRAHPVGGRRRRHRGVRRRRAHEREGVPAREVRPHRARHLAHRLQRPLLHVLRGGSGEPGVRHRPGAAVPAHRPRHRRHRAAARLQRRRHDAAVPVAPAERPGGGRAHRRRPAAEHDRASHRRGCRHPRAARAGDRPAAPARHRPRRARRAAPRRRRTSRSAPSVLRRSAAPSRRGGRSARSP